MVPQRRIILLGASNVTRSLPTIVSLAQNLWQEPLEIMAAIGHGRSFGQSSWVLGRKISGIISCHLWDELSRRKSLPTAALVTDVGNDLLYGVTPDRLLEWVDLALDRLTQHEADTIVTSLPLSSISKVGALRYSAFRTLLFPRSRLSRAAAIDAGHEVNGGLQDMAEDRKYAFFTVENEWYGLDPIHIRRRVEVDAWNAILRTWNEHSNRLEARQTSAWRALYIASLPPWERSWFGVSRRRAQPSGQLPDGTTISLY